MEINDLYDLLNDDKKKISSWDTIITYLSKRMSDNDLDGLYTLTLTVINRAEKDNALATSELIYLYLFGVDILEKEHVAWRIKNPLKEIIDKYLPLLENDLNNLKNEDLIIAKEELANIYYNIAIHYERINLAGFSRDFYIKASNLFKEINKISEAAFSYEEAVYMMTRFEKDEQHLPKIEDIRKEFGPYSKGIIKALSGRGKLKRDPIEQDEKYLSIIDSIEEKIVLRIGVIDDKEGSEYNFNDYYLIKKELLKAEGIEWKNPFEMNPSALKKKRK